MSLYCVVIEGQIEDAQLVHLHAAVDAARTAFKGTGVTATVYVHDAAMAVLRAAETATRPRPTAWCTTHEPSHPRSVVWSNRTHTVCCPVMDGGTCDCGAV